MTKHSAHSEYDLIDTVLIKKAAHAFIDMDTIKREWKELNFLHPPDLNQANIEYSKFENIIKAHSNQVHYLSPDARVTMDSLYCRDAAISTNGGMIICNMGKIARASEPQSLYEYFLIAGIPVLGSIKSPGTVEGGDVAWIDEYTLAVGHTYRTNKEGIRQLEDLLKPLGVSLLIASMPHYRGPADVFHLMSVFSPIDKNLAVVYSPLLPISFRNELLDRGYELLELTDNEFDSMGCNVLALGPRVCLIIHDNPNIVQKMKNANCTVYEYEGKEICLAGGGGPTCLTRPIMRLRGIERI